jgi:hypothetical protein
MLTDEAGVSTMASEARSVSDTRYVGCYLAECQLTRPFQYGRQRGLQIGIEKTIAQLLELGGVDPLA